MITGAVVGRDAELGFVEAFLDDLGRGPAGLVLSGEAGIGKTSLWQAGVDEARARSQSVLMCRGVEAEAALSFAGLSELLGDVLDDVAEALSAPRRTALEVAPLLAEPGHGPPDPLAIGLAVHDVLRVLAQRGPLLVAIDGVQWLEVEALIVQGELDQARVYLEAYEENSRRVAGVWAAACATRCRALLDASEGDLQKAVAGFERALVQLGDNRFPLERGRTLLCLGAVRRHAQQRKAAGEALEHALAIFEELGARLWADRARAELARISGRRGGGDELTGTEARVAELAASGRSNKEIAAELFMGMSTVEAHLSHAYRKLGIRSRGGLAARLATTTGEGAKPAA